MIDKFQALIDYWNSKDHKAGYRIINREPYVVCYVKLLTRTPLWHICDLNVCYEKIIENNQSLNLEFDSILNGICFRCGWWADRSLALKLAIITNSKILSLGRPTAESTDLESV